MWTVVYIAPDSQTASMLKEMLENNGLLVTLQGVSQISPGEKSVQILVPQSEAHEAYEIIGSSLKKI